MRGSPYGSQRGASPQFSQVRPNANPQHISAIECRATTILGLSWIHLSGT